MKSYRHIILTGIFVVIFLFSFHSKALSIPFSVELTPTGLGLSGEQNIGFGPYYVPTLM